MYAVNRVDLSVWEWMVAHRSSALTTLFSGVTTLCNPLTVVVITTVVGLALLGRGQGALTLRLAITVAGAWVTATVLKLAVARQRPPVAERLITVTEYSFPSGHATQSIALWSSLAVLGFLLVGTRDRISPHSRHLLCVAVSVLAVLIAVAVGVSRLYLGVHWLTDVVAGWFVGAAWWLGSWRRPLGNAATPVISEV